MANNLPFDRQVEIIAALTEGVSIRATERLVVEVDGGQHADEVLYDERRTRFIERSGLRVLRFWNSSVLTNRDGVCLTILEACGGDRPEWNG